MEKPLLPPGRPFIASARTLTGTVWSTFGQVSSTLVRNKFIVVEKLALRKMHFSIFTTCMSVYMEIPLRKGESCFFRGNFNRIMISRML